VRMATLVRVAVAAGVALLVSEFLVPVHGAWVVPKLGLIGLIYLAILVLTREVTAADLGMGKAPAAEVPPEEPGSEL
jgi:hypothetical protein